MRLHSRLVGVGALIAAATVSAPASAVPIANGTISIADLYVPAVNLSSNPATFTAAFGNTFEVLGTGAFTGVTGMTGVENGTLLFSSTVGATISQTVNNFFQFADGMGGNFSFTPTSVTTRTFAVNPGVTSSISLFLLGNTSDATAGFDPTPTSLTLSLNSTGGSPFSSSETLAIPPAGLTSAVPEPASWGMMIGGLGMVGGALRRRKRAVRFGGYKIA